MGPLSSEISRQHLAFTRWADDRIAAAVAEHMPTDLSVLQHMYLAEVVWFDRVAGKADAQIVDYTAPGNIAELQAAFEAIHMKWLTWATGLADFHTLIPHTNLKGEAFELPAWQIVLHVTNHGSYHRGQVAASLRAAGFAPPATDLIIWYRLQR